MPTFRVLALRQSALTKGSDEGLIENFNEFRISREK